MNFDSDTGSIKGKWFRIDKKIEKRITAKYDKIKDWVMDPKGYFIIGLDREKNLLRVGYCKFTQLGENPINAADKLLTESSNCISENRKCYFGNRKVFVSPK